MEFYTNIKSYGNSILYRGYNNGIRIKEKIGFKPTLYLEPNDTGIKSKFKSFIDDKPLKPKLFESISDAKNFLRSYENVLPIYGNTKWVSNFIQNKFPNEIKFDSDKIVISYLDIETDSSNGFPKPEEAKHEIISISVKNNNSDFFYVWGCKPFDPETSIYKNRVVYNQYVDEASMLTGFLKWWNQNDIIPDVLTGWNIRFFDVPYLVNRINRILGQEKTNLLSPWSNYSGCISEREIRIMGENKKTYEILGISQLDYLDLFKKFTLNTHGNQESYKLGHIAHVILGVSKVSYDEYGSLKNLYEKNHQKFIEYNIRDVELIEKMDEKLGIFNLVLTLSYIGGVNYTDTLGTTAIWESILYRNLLSKKIVPSVNKPRRSYDYQIIGSSDENNDFTTESDFGEDKPFAGGYVKDVHTGIHNWVCSFDLNSLYPNLIVQYNMSTETIVDRQIQNIDPNRILNSDIPKNQFESHEILASNGVLFDSRKRGIIPEIITEIYDKRVSLKSELFKAKQRLETLPKTDKINRFKTDSEISRLENHQTALKILLNSLYGAIGNKHFYFFDVRIAEGTTLSGQSTIRWAEKSINSYLNNLLQTNEDYVIAIDTDSIYLCLDKIVQKFKPKNAVKFLDEFCKKALEPIFEKSFINLSNLVNCNVNRMVMKREVIADRGIWTAKKRYILNVHNNEGIQYTEPKIKMKGVEAIKSSTPEICRGWMKEIFNILLTGNETEAQEQILKYKSAFEKLSPHEIAFPRGTKDISSYSDSQRIYRKGTPIHIRGCLLYNHYLKKNNLLEKYELINEGEKIKFIYLKTPNPINENIISFLNTIPPEFNLTKFIDYDTQFEKTFLAPIQIIFDAISWKSEKVSSLESFFN